MGASTGLSNDFRLSLLEYFRESDLGRLSPAAVTENLLRAEGFELEYDASSKRIRLRAWPDWFQGEFAKTATGDRLLWEAIAWLKVRVLTSEERVIERARSGEVYDEEYFRARGGGSPYVRYPLMYNGFDLRMHFDRLAGELTERYQGGTVLDLGCATGVLVRCLQSRGWNAHGIDISRWAAANSVAPRILCADARALPYAASAFDVVISQDFLEHVDPCQLVRVTKEMVRVAKDSARLFQFIPFYAGLDKPVASFVHLSTASKSWWDQFLGAIKGAELVKSPDSRDQWDYSKGILVKYYELKVRKQVPNLGRGTDTPSGCGNRRNPAWSASRRMRDGAAILDWRGRSRPISRRG